MLIRKAEYSDLETICRIENDSFEEPWSRASIEAEYFRDIAEIFVAETELIVAGYIIVWHIGLESEILTIAVDLTYRHRGIGGALVKHVLSSRKEADKARWFLEAACGNDAACRLYEKFGFVKTGIIKDYYGQDKHAFRMAREKGAPKG